MRTRALVPLLSLFVTLAGASSLLGEPAGKVEAEGGDCIGVLDFVYSGTCPIGDVTITCSDYLPAHCCAAPSSSCQNHAGGGYTLNCENPYPCE